MLRNEIQKRTGLTRKAIEYYEEKGFIRPTKNIENGYRLYSDADLEILRKISLYRKLGLSIGEIDCIINSNGHMLSSILRAKQHNLLINEKRKTLLERVVLGESLENIRIELSKLDQEESKYSKLERVFPGYFGQCFFAAYKPFLNEPLSKEGVSAYQEYVDFLDQLPKFELTSLEQEFIESTTSTFDLDTLGKLNESKIKAISDVEKWFEENKDFINQYEQFKTSTEYVTSPLKQIQDKLNVYMIENKYYEIAIPLIRKFSKSYDLYYKKLLDANIVYTKMKDDNTFLVNNTYTSRRAIMRKCRISVIRKTEYHDLMEKYENPIEHACNMSEGQVFIVYGIEKPEGLCESAWQSIFPFVNVLAHGGENFYDGWMKNPKSAMISCNDGFRPVSFLIEVIEN